MESRRNTILLLVLIALATIVIIFGLRRDESLGWLWIAAGTVDLSAATWRPN